MLDHLIDCARTKGYQQIEISAQVARANGFTNALVLWPKALRDDEVGIAHQRMTKVL